ncbi:MAG: hypothetical protein AAF573_17155, partial [Bacteroidota bacterium]
MKKDIYNFKINQPQPSSDDIAKHKNFDALLRQLEETSAPAEIPPALEQKPRLMWLRYAAAAAAVLLLVIVGRELLQGENTMTEEDYFASQPFINPPLENLAPIFISKTINANQGGVYEYENGSKLMIPSAAFVSKKGAIVEGNVDIKFREMHDYVDFFLSGIPMTYDSAGTRYILESAGMVEIYAEQNGERLQMQEGKEIQVELISYVDMPRLNVSPKYNIYKLNASTRNWEYRAVDKIQVVDNLESAAFQNEELNQLNASFKTSIQKIESLENNEIQNLEASVPLPIAPTPSQRAQSDQLSFDIDISDNASAAVRALGEKYNSIIWHISPNSPEINPNALDVEWESMDLKPLNESDYELTLINGSITEKVIVTPALSGEDYAQAMKTYREQMNDYQAAVADRESKLKASRDAIIAKFEAQKVTAKKQYNSKIEKWRTANQDDPVVNQMVRRKIINRFVADGFGVWNCDRPIRPDDLQIAGKFVSDKAAKNLNDVAYLVNKNRNTIVRIYAKDGAKVRFDQKSDNLMWMVTKDNQIAIFRPESFKEIEK